jgi:2-polyprenyl-3-methyl-5-hydroxy-6-metoxy-1,4-benzoquinol methylase
MTVINFCRAAAKHIEPEGILLVALYNVLGINFMREFKSSAFTITARQKVAWHHSFLTGIPYTTYDSYKNAEKSIQPTNHPFF